MTRAKTSPLPTDAELARQIAGSDAGRSEAEAELYRRFFPRARLYGLRHLRDDDAADDLAQEALLLTLHRLRTGEVREPDKIASFLLGTCRMMALDRRRNESRRGRILETLGHSPDAGPEPPSHGIIDPDRLRDCLNGLAERERSVVVLTFYADRPGEELARDLGLSPANVRVIRHRALGRLRDCLAAGEESR